MGKGGNLLRIGNRFAIFAVELIETRTMLDHKLTIFYYTAKYQNTTRAAEALRLTQPAVSKSIKELETELGITLFNRERGRLALTAAGEYLLAKGEDLREAERKITFGLQQLKDTFSGTIYVGASTTLAQYILPALLAQFRRKYPKININLISGNTAQIEQTLLARDIQVAFIEGTPSQPDIHYIPFIEDEIVLVTRSGNPCPESLPKEALPRLDFALREKGSGTYNVIQRQLAQAGISIDELRRQIVIGSSEGIKQYLKYSDCHARISVFASRHDLAAGTLKIVDIEGLEITRTLYAIHRQGQPDPYAEMLLRFCEANKNKIG